MTMADEHTNFRNQLLAVEPTESVGSEPLNEELRNMYTKKLTHSRKLVLALHIPFALGAALLCGFLAATEPTLPPVARWGLTSGVVFGLAWAAFSAHLLRQGEFDLKADTWRAAAMVLGFNILFMIFCLAAASAFPDPSKGLLLVANGLTFLILGVVHWVNYKIEALELSTRERLLRIELLLQGRD